MRLLTNSTIRKNVFLFIFFFVLAANAVSQSGNWKDFVSPTALPSSGDIRIDSEEELARLAFEVNEGNDFLGRVITLEKDLILSTHYWTPIGGFDNIEMDGPSFRGTFDGNGKIISGVTTDGLGDNWTTGLFGYIRDGAVIKNLVLEDINIKGNISEDSYTGGLVGEAYSNSTFLEISNCYITGNSSVKGGKATLSNGRSYTGGLIGEILYQVNIDRCGNKAVIKGGEGDDVYAGGLIGAIGSNDSSVKCSYNEGAVTGGEGRSVHTGGLIGVGYSGLEKNFTIRDCYQSGDVTAGVATAISNYTGGLAGYIDSYGDLSITNSYASGTLIGKTSKVGGLVGHLFVSPSQTVTIENCLSLQSIFSIESGGTANRIAEYLKRGTLVTTNNYALIGGSQPAWEEDGEGTPEYGTSLTDNNAPFNKSTYTGWDFDNTWYIPSKAAQLPQLIPPLFGGGNGESSSPYLIHTRAHLEALADVVNQGNTFSGKHFLLVPEDGSTLDLSGSSWTPIGRYNSSYSDPSFRGVFDGNGKTILGVTTDGLGDHLSVGLFGNVGDGAAIKNLELKDIDIKGNDSDFSSATGGLVGHISSIIALIEISDCYITGNSSVKGGDVTVDNRYSSTGGLIGEAYGLFTVDRCGNHGAVIGGKTVKSSETGGLIGYVSQSTSSVSSSFNTGSVTGGEGIQVYTGGLIGYGEAYINKSFTLQDCYQSGDITEGRATTSENYTGGLAGVLTSSGDISLTNSYASGTLIGKTSISGGLLGRVVVLDLHTVTIANCMSLQTSFSIKPEGTANRIVGEIDSEGTATITNNYALISGDNPAWTNPSDNSLHGSDCTEKWNNEPLASLKPMDMWGIAWTFDTDDKYLPWLDLPGAPQLLKPLYIPTPPVTPPVPTHFTIDVPEVTGALVNPGSGRHSVLSGSVFEFSLTLLAAYNESDPVVLCNGEALSCHSYNEATCCYTYRIEGINSATTITVSGIKKNDPLGILSPSADITYRVYTENSLLCLESLKASSMAVYGMDGKLYAQRPINEGLTQIPLPAGMYIVRIDGERWKIMINY